MGAGRGEGEGRTGTDGRRVVTGVSHAGETVKLAKITDRHDETKRGGGGGSLPSRGA